jgi:hypothetical protein
VSEVQSRSVVGSWGPAGPGDGGGRNRAGWLPRRPPNVTNQRSLTVTVRLPIPANLEEPLWYAGLLCVGCVVLYGGVVTVLGLWVVESVGYGW